MKREELIAKINDPNEVKRVMERVDEASQLLGKTTDEQLELFYDECAGYYDAACRDAITSYEVVGKKYDPLYKEERDVIKLNYNGNKSFSFLHFNAIMSECMDRYRHMMYDVEIENSIMNQSGIEKISLMKIVDSYVARPTNKYNERSFVQQLHKVVAKYMGDYNNALDKRAEDLADAQAILKVKDYMLQTREQAHKNYHFIMSVSFKPSDDEAIKIKGEKAIELMGKVFVPYYCDRFLNKFNQKTLEKELKKCDILKGKTYHKTIFEIYKLFIKYYDNKFSYTLDTDRYKLGEKNGKFPGLKSEISVWIYDLMAEINDHDFDKYNGRKDKVDTIKTRMETKDNDLGIDLPREWTLFLY